MSESRLIELSYFDPKSSVRLTAYADTVILENTGGVSTIVAIRFGGYPEMVRAMSDAIYGGGTIEAKRNGLTRMRALILLCAVRGLRLGFEPKRTNLWRPPDMTAFWGGWKLCAPSPKYSRMWTMAIVTALGSPVERSAISEPTMTITAGGTQSGVAIGI